MFDFMLTTVGEKITIGGQVTLLGMGTVFSVLALLWGLVEVLHFLLNKPVKRKTTNVVEESHTSFPVAPAEINMPAPSPAVDDLAIIAVITAAIAAASGNSSSSFRVVSFKRANNKYSGK